MLAHTRATEEFTFESGQHPALHPGQSARILKQGKAVGWLGVMHPELEKDLSLEGPVVLFELQAEALMEAQHRQFQPISKFPNIRRDLSLVVDDQVSSQQILDTIDEIGIKTIAKRWVFDVYQGKGVENGRKSMSLGLILLDSSRTLTDEDVEEVISGVVMDLKTSLGAALRE